MPTINDELLRIEGAKTAIATAIGGKGVTVPANAKIDDFANLIDAIQTGGGADAILLGIMNKTITSVDIPSGVTTIPDSFFSGCASLSSVTFPSSFITIGQKGFYNCVSLATVDLRGTRLTTIGGNTFYNCRNLEEVYIPATINITFTAAFSGCSELGIFVILATTPPRLSSNVFSNTPIASGTGKIYVPNGYGNTYKGASGWSAFANQIYELDSNGNIPT